MTLAMKTLDSYIKLAEWLRPINELVLILIISQEIVHPDPKVQRCHSKWFLKH